MDTSSFITTSSLQTKKLGEILASELRGGEIICLDGDLGAGKTTFAQGLLKGLKIKGPHTSPTFGIIKHYHHKTFAVKHPIKKQAPTGPFSLISEVYHIDAYRVSSKDLLNLGWKDFAGKKDSVVILEWPKRIEKLLSFLPATVLWIKFEWLDEKQRNITLEKK